MKFDRKYYVVAAGTNGADIYDVDNKRWTRSSSIPINVLAVSPDYQVVFGAGPNGTVVKGTRKK